MYIEDLKRRFRDLILKVKANPKPWIDFAMLLNLPIYGILLAMVWCNVKKVKVVKKHHF